MTPCAPSVDSTRLLPPLPVVRPATGQDLDGMLATIAVDDRDKMKRRVVTSLAIFPEGVQIAVDPLSGECVGFALCQIWHFRKTHTFDEVCIHSPGTIRHDASGTELHVSTVCIAAEHQGKGLSDYLMTTAIINLRDRFPRLRSVLIVTDKGAKESLHFFAKRRFIAVDHIKEFGTSSGRAARVAIVMRKFFGPADAVLPQMRLLDCARRFDFQLS